jgi:ABC-type molybdate transport system substrate-binding protein
MARLGAVFVSLGGTVMTTFVVGTASVNAQRSGSETVSVLHAGSLGAVMDKGLDPSFERATGLVVQGTAPSLLRE